jgi:hypothetical protein
MANLILNGSTSGSVTLSSPAVSGTTTLTLPTTSGTVLTNGTNTNFPAGSVVQVLQTVKTDTFSTTSTSFVDITSLSVSITPSSNTSKILVLVDIGYGITNAGYSMFNQLLRDSTAIYQGDASSSSNRGQAMLPGDIAGSQFFIYRPATIFLDSPATTSSVTYKVQMKTGNGTVVYVNRTGADLGTATGGIRSASSITVMEVKV